MKVFLKPIALLCFIALLASCSKISLTSPREPAEFSKGKDLVSVNNTTFKEGFIDALTLVNPRAEAQLKNPDAKKQFIQNLIEQELLYQEAMKRGFDKSREVQIKQALYQKIVLAQSLLDSELEKKAKEYYESHKTTDFTRVKISHIQIDFKDPNETPAAQPNPGEEKKEDEPTLDKAAALAKAQAIKTRLQGGEDFAKVAEEVSDDKVSKRKGGDLGPISKDDKRLARRNLNAISDAAFSLKKDEVSDPIETPKSYHIIKVTSDPEVTPYDEAERIIEFQIQKDVKDELVEGLKAKSNVVYRDASLKPTPVEPAMPMDMPHGIEGSPAPAPTQEGVQAPGAAPAPTTPPSGDVPTPPAQQPSSASEPAPSQPSTPPAPQEAPVTPPSTPAQ